MPTGDEKPKTLRDIIQPADEVDEQFYITDEEKLNKFKYLRGPKKIQTVPTGDEKPKTLRDIIQPADEVDEQFYITDEEKLNKFKYLRGPKKIQRKSTDGHEYTWWRKTKQVQVLTWSEENPT